MRIFGIPSLSLDQRELLKIEAFITMKNGYCFLIRLQNPKTRLIYVTSQPPIPASLITILLLPGIPFSHARDRLPPLHDSSPSL